MQDLPFSVSPSAALSATSDGDRLEARELEELAIPRLDVVTGDARQPVDAERLDGERGDRRAVDQRPLDRRRTTGRRVSAR